MYDTNVIEKSGIIARQECEIEELQHALHIATMRCEGHDL